MADETTILVVDDDPDIRAGMSDVLEDRGFRVDVAHDGTSALQLVRKNHYDIALLDFKMPDMDGAALFEQMRALQPSTVALMITAHAGSGGVQRARDCGTWKVLRKPVEVDEVIQLIGEALALDS